MSEIGPASAPHAIRECVERYARGDISPELALMQCVLATGSGEQALLALARLADETEHRRAIERLRDLARRNGGLDDVGRLVQRGLADIPVADDPVAAIRDQFDRAVQLGPEASVALYSLGSAEVLDRATREIVDRLVQWNLVGPAAAVLDLGCGIGRMARALAPLVASVEGVDVAPQMIAEARRRCTGFFNVHLSVGNGRDLDALPAQSFDLVLAVDTFPYLVAAGAAVVAAHMAGARRLLRPGGALALFNFSYRGDLERDRADVADLAATHGFGIARCGTRDLALWDGAAFVLMNRGASARRGAPAPG